MQERWKNGCKHRDQHGQSLGSENRMQPGTARARGQIQQQARQTGKGQMLSTAHQLENLEGAQQMRVGH